MATLPHTRAAGQRPAIGPESAQRKPTMSVLHLLRTVGIACLLLAAAGAATLTAAPTGAAPATGLAISGRTTTADGTPIVGATVQAQAATG